MLEFLSQNFDLKTRMAVVTNKGGAEELPDVVFGQYRPNQVVAWKDAGDESVIPLLKMTMLHMTSSSGSLSRSF